MILLFARVYNSSYITTGVPIIATDDGSQYGRAVCSGENSLRGAFGRALDVVLGRAKEL